MRWPGRPGAESGSAAPPDDGGPQVPPAPVWMRWLPAFYVAGILVLEPLTPVQWPVSFLLIALPVIAAFAHGPAAVAAVTVFAIAFEGALKPARRAARAAR